MTWKYYHYPLADYAFQAIRHGRFPQVGSHHLLRHELSWQTCKPALFYPPQWVMFAARMPHPKLSYQSMEYLVLAHVWLAFFVVFSCGCIVRRALHWLASILGAGGFRIQRLLCFFSCSIWESLALIAWMPLGFWAIDEAAESRRWSPLWKLAVAFAMCILAGYPTMWIVFALSMITYAAARARPLKLLAGSRGRLGAFLPSSRQSNSCRLFDAVREKKRSTRHIARPAALRIPHFLSHTLLRTITTSP